MNVVGENIRKYRLRNNFNQAKLAKQLNISISAFSKMENGIIGINISKLREIALIFDISLSYLLSEQGKDINTTTSIEIEKVEKLIAIADHEVINLQKVLIALHEKLRPEKP